MDKEEQTKCKNASTPYIKRALRKKEHHDLLILAATMRNPDTLDEKRRF
ncbi:MAG: hypothetical protein VB032_01975 [Burkholderiaceae bacterium]|nr:hypothetical protein [Burkholderiaceae bacterium]